MTKALGKDIRSPSFLWPSADASVRVTRYLDKSQGNDISMLVDINSVQLNNDDHIPDQGEA